MKNFLILIDVLMLCLFIMILFNSCKKEIEPPLYSQTVLEIHHTIQKERPDIIISEVEIEEALRSNTQTSICSWDFNFNGIIESSDLLRVLSKFGVEYNSSDLLAFLSVFGEEYVVDVIPAWNNFIQDNTFAVSSFSKVVCNGSVVITSLSSLPTTSFNETKWYYNGDLIGNGDSLLIQTYGQNGQITNFGWQGPCDGTKPITLEITHNGKIFSRTVNSRISTANYPDSIPTCDNLLGLTLFDAILANSSFVGVPLVPYQFCINCD
jgi:hypothetical protein